MAPRACPVCGNTDFDEQDGLFFCTECDTQSQEIHVQESEAHDFASSGYSKRLSSLHQPQSQQHTSATLAKEKLLGRPWTIYEAYQYVILAQVNALIQLGASEHLKDVVYTIWANYLRRIGVAFCGKREKLVPDIVLQTGCFRDRELNRGTLGNPRNKHKPSKSKDASEEHHESEIEDEMDSDDAVVELNEGVVRGQKTPVKGRKSGRSQVARTSPQWMNLQKTITFCYMGLLITDPLILPNDVIRWIYEGKIPFLSVTHVLPQDMVLSYGDQRLFQVTTFSCNNLRYELSKMLHFLSLDDIPLVSVERLISRFVDELALPDSFKTTCQQLARTFPYHYFGSSSITLYFKADTMALGYIIAALSLALGLDGARESELSDCSRKLQELIGPEPKLFIWDDWKQMVCDRMHHTFDSCAQFSQPLHHSEVRHSDSLIECFEKIGSGKKKWTTKALNSRRNLAQRFHTEFQEGLTSPLHLALDRLTIHNSDTESERREQQWREKSQKWKESTMCHILDPDCFREKFREQVRAGGNEAHILMDYLKTRPKAFVPFDLEESLPEEYRNEDAVKGLHSDHRHAPHITPQTEPVMWLIDVCSQMAGCSQVHIGKLVEGIHKCILLKNSARPGHDPDLVVTYKGPLPQGRRFRAKFKQHRGLTHQTWRKRAVNTSSLD